MADPTEPTLPELADLPAAEYRQVRETGNTVADVVQARAETPEASSPGESVAEPETSAADPRARDETGRFITPAESKPAAGDPRKDPGAKKTRIQDEINVLSRQNGETKRERDAIAAEIAVLKAERDALKPTTSEHQPPQAKAPKFPSYEVWSAEAENAELTYEDYDDAKADFRFDQRDQKAKAASAEAEARSAHDTAWKPFRDRQAAFRADHPDFDAVIARGADLKPSEVMAEAIRDSAHGPALQYYLAQHIDEAREINGLGMVAAVRKLDTLITSLSAASAVTTDAIPQTQADAPFETVGAAPTASSRSLERVAAASTSNADYRRAREQQMGGRR